MKDSIFGLIGLIDKPYVLFLIGPPLCGKSTLIKELKSYLICNQSNDFYIISRDKILMDLYSGNDKDYSKVWNTVDQKEVDKILNESIDSLSVSNKNVIIDMTNMNVKARRNKLDKFKSHFKIAIVLEFDKEELYKRNESRKEKENKFIPLTVIDSMIDSYKEPTLLEGFNFILKTNF